MSQFHFEEDSYHRQLDLRLWRRVVRHAAPYWPQFTGLGLAGVAVATIDVCFPIVVGQMIDEATTNGATARLATFGAVYVALCALLSACIFAFIVFAGRTATGVACDLRRKGFARLQQLSFSYYDTRPTGWLVTRLTSDVSKVSSLLPWFMLDLVWGSCMIGGIIIAMFWLNWQLAVAVLLIVPPLSVVSVLFQRRLLESSRRVRRINSQITASLAETIAGVRTTKALVREDESHEEFRALTGDMHRHCMRNALQSAVYLPLIMTLGSLGVGIALWRGGLSLEAGGLTIGTLVAFMQFAALFHMPIEELARRFTDLQSAQAAAERIQTLLDTEPEIADSPAVRARIEAHAGVSRTGRGVGSELAEDGLSKRIRRIEFRNVGFSYVPDEPVLEDFCLEVRPGQTVALVGATGGGKSTIVSLLARFYEPTSGEILLDGVEYRERSLHWLQSNLGIVLQAPVLFSGSIRENIRYGRLDATDEQVLEAARLVNANGFITELDGGYDFDVGERGARLSTGQRQLISLSRAVLANPQIFILDEATSSVDTETERLIQDAVATVLKGRISFVIAHRLSTIRSADLILVIDGGRVVERGTHTELMAKRGRYRDLYLGQYARQREEGAWRNGGA